MAEHSMKIASPENPGVDRALTVRTLMQPVMDYLAMDGVDEVAVNRPCELWTKRFPHGWEQHEVPALTPELLRRLAKAICAYNGFNLDNNPSAPVVYPDGERGQISSPPSCVVGQFLFTIRKHSRTDKRLDDLAASGAFEFWRDVSFNQPSAEEAQRLTEARGFERLEQIEVDLLDLKRNGNIIEFLRQAVLLERNFVVVGKTGSGKTTISRSLIREVPRNQRLFTLEDVHELFLNGHENKGHLLFGPNGLTAQEQLKALMRLSPDRFFLAELRGDEAWEYISGLNTGHPGSVTTVHANGAIETFARIGTLIKTSETGRSLDREEIMKELYRTLDVVLYIKDRKLLEVFYDPIFKRKNLV